MIEVVLADRCIGCGKCVEVCPTDVFDPGPPPAAIPVIARQSDCQTCFLCEAYCPADALFVAPSAQPLEASDPLRDPEHLERTGMLGSYRAAVGWDRGRKPGAATAVGPSLTPVRISTTDSTSAPRS